MKTNNYRTSKARFILLTLQGVMISYCLANEVYLALVLLPFVVISMNDYVTQKSLEDTE